MVNAGIVKLIHFTFNDVIKLVKSEYGWDVSYLRCSILNNNKRDFTIRAGDTIFVNYNLGFILKNQYKIEFDNYKKFFAIAIAKEVGKEVVNKYFKEDDKIRWLNIISKCDNKVLEEDNKTEPLSDYIASMVYNIMLPDLNKFKKKTKKEEDNTDDKKDRN